ncbi:helix-turn-helix domain-containing protein [Mycolicibacterium sp.]|uniref:helix-turn-helix domain-containing protein n=1 Tax=Mycolicibacterium sp. TaxID=2320850 RepID=UPI0037C9F0FB
MPTRPDQNDPDRVVEWERRRHALGQRIRELREKRGMTQERLAITSSVTRNTLIEVEKGRRGLLYERLLDLADALDVSVARMMKGID